MPSQFAIADNPNVTLNRETMHLMAIESEVLFDPWNDPSRDEVELRWDEAQQLAMFLLPCCGRVWRAANLSV